MDKMQTFWDRIQYVVELFGQWITADYPFDSSGFTLSCVPSNHCPVISTSDSERITSNLYVGRKKRVQCLTLLFIFFVSVALIAPSSVLAFDSTYICNKIRGLTPQQRTMCMSCPLNIVEINEGVHMGMKECKFQFRKHRWNCSSQDHNSIFGQDQKLGTKEAAYDSAIRAAGVLHAIVTACGKGNLCDCGCDQNIRRRPSYWRKKWNFGGNGRRSRALQNWKWGGCSIDMPYGLEYSQRFWDAREIRESPRKKMNLHNYEAGRRAVVRKVKLNCKCHGVSASCTSKTCWVTLPEFHEVGTELMKMYKRARKLLDKHNYLYYRKDGGKRKPLKKELVYLEHSPSYCAKDSRVGTLGTVGRTCNKTSTDTDNCNDLCCGRGFITRPKVRKWACKCKFYWCCYVECEECSEEIEQYTCS